MPVNGPWHRRNPMPRRATLEQRVVWHEEHERECACRQPPVDLRERIEALRSERKDAARPEIEGGRK